MSSSGWTSALPVQVPPCSMLHWVTARSQWPAAAAARTHARPQRQARRPSAARERPTTPCAERVHCASGRPAPRARSAPCARPAPQSQDGLYRKVRERGRGRQAGRAGAAPGGAAQQVRGRHRALHRARHRLARACRGARRPRHRARTRAPANGRSQMGAGVSAPANGRSQTVPALATHAPGAACAAGDTALANGRYGGAPSAKYTHCAWTLARARVQCKCCATHAQGEHMLRPTVRAAQTVHAHVRTCAAGPAAGALCTTWQVGPPRDCKTDSGRCGGVQHPHPQIGIPATARAAGRRQRRAGRPGARRRARPRHARPAAAPPAAAARPPAPPRSADAPRCAARGQPPPAAGTRLDRVRVRGGQGEAAR